MANPIVDNVEYFIEQGHRRRSSVYDRPNPDGRLSDPENESDDVLGKNDYVGMFMNRWHSMIRRISVSIQRDSGTPDHEIVVGTNIQPTGAEEDLMIHIPATQNQDDNLPSIEEVAKENARLAQVNERRPSYFENPFIPEDAASSVDTTEVLTSMYPKHDETRDALPLPTLDTVPPMTPLIYLSDLASPHSKGVSSVHWPSKVLERLRPTYSNLIKRRSTYSAPPTSIPLAPYYPHAFVAPCIAMWPKDEHGRKPPPILFGLLSVSITESEIDQTGIHRVCVYHIELHYGEIKWTIKRSIIDFYNLYLLLKFRMGISGGSPEHLPSFPSQLTHLCNAALISIRIKQDEDEHGEVSRETHTKRRIALENYLRELIKHPSTIYNYDMCEFMEISAISIVKDMGWKGKEGYMEHKTTPASLSILNSLRFDRGWVKEWIILRDSYIAFCRDVGSPNPSDVLLLDRHFRVERKRTAFAPYHQTHIEISNNARRIEIKGSTSRYTEDWLHHLYKMQRESPWVKNHRFASFAPVRENVRVKWFVDSKEYFEAAAEAILSAKSDIYIEDWWLSPELYLKRPPKGNEDYRLDRLLKRKACEGVMIYIVIYKNMSVALPLDSQHTKDWLQSIHPNIIVQRHSDLTSPLWAHHEKILVIDNRLAFIGGLDLCFGRYDTSEHDLTDYCADDEECLQVFPGQDYSNPRIKDFTKVSQYDRELIDKQSAPRMPWHDIHTIMIGLPARDVARHFIQRWNFIKSTTRGKDRADVPYLMPKGEYVSSEDDAKFDGTCRAQIIRSSSEWSQGIPREYSIYNAYMECITRAKHFIYIENQFFITATHAEDRLIKNKIGQAIVERIKRAHQEKKKFRIIVVLPCAPGFEGDFVSTDRRSMPLRSVTHYQYMSISRGGHSVLEQLARENIPADQYIGFYSLRNWGRVKKRPRMTVSTPTSPAVSRNNSQKQKRWSRLRPRSSTASLTNIDNAQSRHSDGIYHDHVIRSRSFVGPMTDKERDHRMEYVTEQVYIHSKLMIVDDRLVVCGSANLNDRSQLGNRDSEIAIVVEDTDMVDSRMNGKPYKAARFALTLRQHLFMEHLGFIHSNEIQSTMTRKEQEALVTDPLDDHFYTHVWNKTAQTNTSAFRTLFRCVPDDNVHTQEQHRQFVPDPIFTPPGHIDVHSTLSDNEIDEKLSTIRGHLVHFPTQYLCQESLTSSIVQEAVPPAVFT